MLNREGRLSYAVSRAGKPVILSSPLGIRREDQAFESALSLDHAGTNEQRREVYELFGGVSPKVNHVLNHRSLDFVNTNGLPITIDLVASDEGVAFRYRFSQQATNVAVVEAELTGFQLPAEASGWLEPYHAAGPYTPAYEDFYFHVAPGDRPPRSREQPVGWCFPALFHVAAASAWVLLTESGTDSSYCGCHLDPDSSGGLYRIAFPLPNEHTKGQTTNLTTNPRWPLPWTLPWRIFMLGKSAGDIATATLVTDLAPASRVADTSWIKPGRTSWAWWSYPDGPATAERFNEFTDFAARMKWEYTLFDAGWWTPGLKSISSYAISNGIVPLAWSHASDFYDAGRRKRKLDEMAADGIRGVKIDFWCSDRQATMAAMQALFQDAASRKMVVNLHGCTIPRGWQRTWPNFLAAEAVLGTESYFYESRYSAKAAELNTVLPFTRNAIGPMDITPVACSIKKYRRTTTAAHELAAALIFTSGLIHYADRPQFFESLPPEVLRVFQDAPARWDETRCLLGEPGRVVVFARRAGASWFIAGINGTAGSLPVKLDLSSFKQFQKRTAVSEGSDALMQVSVGPLPMSKRWQHAIPPRGGFILRLEK
jgi:alpha-glucosidase